MPSIATTGISSAARFTANSILEHPPFSADAALPTISPELAREAFSPLAGHINRFCGGLMVNGCTARMAGESAGAS